MELAAVALLVMIGVGAIVYAGTRQPKAKAESPAASDGSAASVVVDSDGAASSDGGGAGGE
jgi:hypothetical protein